MPKFYMATLKLTCERRNESLQSAFNARWPRRLERQWMDMTFGLDEDIEAFLNGKIWNQCRESIGQDLHELAVGIEALKPGGWMPAPGGGYLQMSVVEVKTLVRGALKPWMLKDASGQESSICVHASLDVVESREEGQ